MKVLKDEFIRYLGLKEYNGEYGIYESIKIEEKKRIIKEKIEKIRDDSIEIEKRVEIMSDG